MSEFLGYEDGLVALGQTITQMKDTIRGLFTSYGWQVVREQIPGVVLNGTTSEQDEVASVDPPNRTIGSSGWVGFCADTAFVPTAMVMVPTQIGGIFDYVPKDFVLEYSDDGAGWNQQQTWTNDTTTVLCEPRWFTISGASAHRWWRIRVTNCMGSSTTFGMHHWYLENASGWRTHADVFIDLIPPSSETIGNSLSREIVRMVFTGTKINIRAIQELLQDIPYRTVFTAPVAGAVTLSITLGGVTVSYTGAGGDSASKNARGLYEAVRDSANANFTAWNWYWDNGVIHAVNKTYAKSPGLITCSNITNNIYAKSCKAGTQTSGENRSFELNVDLVNGFLYYFQLCKRGFALATKTNAGFSGPIHFVYASNAFAVDKTPTQDRPYVPPCTPIEVVYGVDDAPATAPYTLCAVTHWFGMMSTFRTSAQTPEWTPAGAAGCADNRWTYSQTNLGIQDCAQSVRYVGSLDVRPVLCGEGFLASGSGDGYTIHQLKGFPMAGSGVVYLGSNRTFFPGNDSEDWYRYAGTLVDEQLLFAPHTGYETTLTSNITSSDATIVVASTARFPASGHIVIDGEVIAYAAKTSGSFTGCTRGQMSTLARQHYASDRVNVGGWFVKIGNGLLFAGYTSPA